MAELEKIPAGGASASKRRLVLAIGADARLECDLKRHLSPRTVGIVTRSLPLRGNIHTMEDGIVYIKVQIDSGMERARSRFARGDVAFLPSMCSICFFLHDASPSRAMTPMGRLVGDVGLLESARQGTMLSLYEEDADD